MIKGIKISVIIPVYNEKRFLPLLLAEVERQQVDEIIVVDDGSTDGTGELLRAYDSRLLKKLCHETNKGKGAAVRTALAVVCGDIIIIQDADMEYDPGEYARILDPILRDKADVVYGSRFKGTTRVFHFWHYVGNKLLTLTANILFNSTLTDLETCYKVFRRDCVADFVLKSNGWGFDPEITAHFLRKKYRVVEVPISYCGRTYEEGKKIRWTHGLTVLLTLITCRLRK